MLFATYRFLMKLQTQTRHVDDDAQSKSKGLELEPTLGQVFLAGAGCGLASTYVNPPTRSTKHRMKKSDVSLSCRLLTTPIELVKIQQQKQQQQRTPGHDVTGPRRRSSSEGHTLPARAVALQVYRAGGIRGLYHGLSATILRDVGGYGLYFFGVRPVSCSFPAHKYPP